MPAATQKPKTGVQARFSFKDATPEQLEERANDHHGQYVGSIRQALHHALEAGSALAEMKRRLAHGEWTPWIKAHFRGSPETARDYLRVAANWPAVVDAGLEDETLSKVLAFLAGRRPAPPALTADDDEAVSTERATERREITVFVDPAEARQVEAMIRELMEFLGTPDVSETVLEAVRRFHRDNCPCRSTFSS